MSKPLAILIGLVLAAWLVYMTWLTGYRAGFDDGSSTAWDTARTTLAPHLIADDAFDDEAASLGPLPR